MATTLNPQRQKKAKEYARLTRRLFYIDLAWGVLFLLLVLLSGFSVTLRDFLDFPQPARVALFFVILILCYGVVAAPLTFYGDYVLPRRYGLSIQRFRGWLYDLAKSGAIGLVLGVGLMVAIYWFLGSFPETWWLLASAFMVLLTLIMTYLAPLIIIPLFFKMTPLSDRDLCERLSYLAERARTKVRGIFTINLSRKTTAANAALMGLRNTRRIALGDTLLDRYSPDEIEVIVAHELGHHVHRDIAKLIVAQPVAILAGLYLASLVLGWAVPYFGFYGIEDVASFPLLALVLGAFTLVMMPIRNAYSRHLEGAADEYALTLTDNPEAFTNMMTKLANQNLSEAEPSRWVQLLFYDHPPYSKRVGHAQKYAELRRERRATTGLIQ